MDLAAPIPVLLYRIRLSYSFSQTLDKSENRPRTDWESKCKECTALHLQSFRQSCRSQGIKPLEISKGQNKFVAIMERHMNGTMNALEKVILYLIFTT